MKVTPINPVPENKPDPQYRLDVLLKGLAQEGAHWAERRLQALTGFSVDLWGGNDGLGAVVDRKLSDIGVPEEKLTPMLIMENLGLVSSKPKRIRKAG